MSAYKFFSNITKAFVVVSLLLAIILSFKFGVKVGLFLGLIFFLVIGGFDLCWQMLISKTETSEQKKLYENEKKAFNEETKNNPTLR